MRKLFVTWAASILLIAGLLACGMPGAPASISITFNAPTTNTDGSPLTDLAGFRVYWSTRPRSDGYKYPNSVDIGLTTTYTITELVRGAEYFITVTAYNARGVESGYSNEVSAKL